MSKFFINRPIVAMVISIIMVIIGVVAMVQLPIAQYPDLAPPEILVQATYVGADSQTIEQSVATPIEQEMQGVDKMLYMNSVNDSTGLMKLRVTFDVGTDPNDDQLLSQMRYSLAESLVPADVRDYGVSIKKSPVRPDGDILSVLAQRNLRRHFPIELCLHQHQRSHEPYERRGPGDDFWRGPVRDALLGAARHVSQLGRYHQRYHRRADKAEHRQSRRSDRRCAGTTRAAVHLYSQSAGTTAEPGGVWQHRRTRQSGRLDRTDAAMSRGWSWARATTAQIRTAERKARRDHRYLPAAGLERDRYDEPRQEADGGIEEKIPARPRLYDFARHDTRGYRRHP